MTHKPLRLPRRAETPRTPRMRASPRGLVFDNHDRRGLEGDFFRQLRQQRSVTSHQDGTPILHDGNDVTIAGTLHAFGRWLEETPKAADTRHETPKEADRDTTRHESEMPGTASDKTRHDRDTPETASDTTRYDRDGTQTDMTQTDLHCHRIATQDRGHLV